MFNSRRKFIYWVLLGFVVIGGFCIIYLIWYDRNTIDITMEEEQLLNQLSIDLVNNFVEVDAPAIIHGIFDYYLKNKVLEDFLEIKRRFWEYTLPVKDVFFSMWWEEEMRVIEDLVVKTLKGDKTEIQYLRYVYEGVDPTKAIHEVINENVSIYLNLNKEEILYSYRIGVEYDKILIQAKEDFLKHMEHNYNFYDISLSEEDLIFLEKFRKRLVKILVMHWKTTYFLSTSSIQAMFMALALQHFFGWLLSNGSTGEGTDGGSNGSGMNNAF